MKKYSTCKMCGAEFVKLSANHNYCSEECRKAAIKRNKHIRKCRKDVTAPHLTIHDMVKAMLRLSKERGYTVQYGELQGDLLTGRVKVVGGKIV